MKTFDYIKNIIKVIAWPILLGIGQFFIILIFSYSFNNNIYNNLVKENNTLTPDQINEMFSIYSKTDEYKNSLTNYINENTKINIENNDKDFLTIISTINLFIRKAYNDDSKAKKMFEHINEYLMYLNLNEKKYSLRIS